MKHNKTVMFIQISECQAPLHICKATPTAQMPRPPIDFLVTVLLLHQAFH